jgi:hypothetical protein
MKHKYYVVLRRYLKEKDIISIYDFNEAVKRNWIDSNGNRVWVVPTAHEFTPTFVWGFDSLSNAVLFYDALAHNELGIECSEI